MCEGQLPVGMPVRVQDSAARRGIAITLMLLCGGCSKHLGFELLQSTNLSMRFHRKAEGGETRWRGVHGSSERRGVHRGCGRMLIR